MSSPERAADVEVLRQTAQSLMLDVAAAELVSALRDAAVPSIILKGPSIQRLLYADGAPRPYCDSDVLVAPDRLRAAGAVLEKLGYARQYRGEMAGGTHADLWIRSRDGTHVDLHWTLCGVEAPPVELWRALAATTETINVGGVEAEVVTPPGIALQVALHALADGPTNAKSISDLERALAQLDESTWRAAAALAETLRTTETFAAGLRLAPAGEALAGKLQLSARTSVETAVRSRRKDPLSVGLAELAATPGLRRKLSLLARELVPSRRFMRFWWPPSGRGGLWMLAAYVRRPIWLLVWSGPALITWRRAVRESRRSG
jgi:hypothetical protein